MTFFRPFFYSTQAGESRVFHWGREFSLCPSEFAAELREALWRKFSIPKEQAKTKVYNAFSTARVLKRTMLRVRNIVCSSYRKYDASHFSYTFRTKSCNAARSPTLTLCGRCF